MSPWGGGADPVLAVARIRKLTFFTECHRAAKSRYEIAKGTPEWGAQRYQIRTRDAFRRDSAAARGRSRRPNLGRRRDFLPAGRVQRGLHVRERALQRAAILGHERMRR